MLTGRLTKDSADLSRVTIDFTPWLDTSETVTSITTPVVALEQNALWQTGAWTNQPPLPPLDTTPLVVNNAFIVSGGLMVQLILAIGTPGLTYKVTFAGSGSSSLRTKQIDILVTLRQIL